MLIASISGITSVCKVTDKLIYFSLNFTARYVCSIQEKYGAYPGGENPDIPDEPDDSTPMMPREALGYMPGVGLSSASGCGVL